MRIPAPALVRLAVALVLMLAAVAAQAGPVPAGFEDLVTGQRERLEVRAFGRSAGLWPAWVTLDHIQLEDPGQVLVALGLSLSAQQALLPALSAPLPRDSHLACIPAQPHPGCGWRAPSEDLHHVPAIFDEGDSALLLFPALRWVPRAQPASDGLHAPSEHADNALLHQHSLTLSGDGREYAFNAHGSAALGVQRNGYLGGTWTHARHARPGQPARDVFQVDDLYYRHDLARRHYLQLGRMDRRNLASQQGGQFGLGLLPLERFDGVRVGTTQAYVDADAPSGEAPITVLLSRPARVDAFDGDRLLQTFYLPPGVSDLDTRRFPAGSYEVTLRIHEDGRLVRSERHPFVRGQDWGQPGLQWFVQGGRHQAAFTPVGHGTLQAGVRLPWAGRSGMSLGVARIDQRRYAELRTGVRHRLGTHELHAELGIISGSDGSRGGQQQLSVRNRATWNLFHQRMRGTRCREQLALDRDRLGCADAVSASLSVPLGVGSLHLGHTRRRSVAAEAPRFPAPPTQTARSVQVNYSHSRQWRGLSVSGRVGAWHQSGPLRDRGAQLGLTFSRLRHAAGSSLLRRVGIDARQRRHGEPEHSLQLAQSWRREEDGSAREAGAEVRVQDTGVTDALLALRSDTPMGHTGVVLSHQPRPHGTAYSLNHGSALALAPGGLFWGSASGADAGVAVSVAAADLPAQQGAAAEVQASAQRRQVVRFGQRRLLPLRGYQRHRVDVHDVAVPLQDVDVRVAQPGTAHRPFLLPGRVIALPVGVEASVSYLGSARDAAGRALAGARILNAALPPLGRDGGFIAEFAQRQEVLYLLRQGQLLQCPLRVQAQRSVMRLVGQIVCAPLAREALPAHIGGQPRVQRLLDEALPIAQGMP